MTQIWISEAGALAPADAEYVPVDDDGQAVGSTVRLRSGEPFPVAPGDSAGWMAEADARAGFQSSARER
jgi:hypothetical protein